MCDVRVNLFILIIDIRHLGVHAWNKMFWSSPSPVPLHPWWVLHGLPLVHGNCINRSCLGRISREHIYGSKGGNLAFGVSQFWSGVSPHTFSRFPWKLGGDERLILAFVYLPFLTTSSVALLKTRYKPSIGNRYCREKLSYRFPTQVPSKQVQFFGVCAPCPMRCRCSLPLSKPSYLQERAEIVQRQLHVGIS